MIIQKIEPGDRIAIQTYAVNNPVNNLVKNLKHTGYKNQNQNYSQLMATYSQQYSQYLIYDNIERTGNLEDIYFLTSP